MTSVTLGYSLKLYPSRNKADTLAALAALFQRLHADVTNQLASAEQQRLPSTKRDSGSSSGVPIGGRTSTIGVPVRPDTSPEHSRQS